MRSGWRKRRCRRRSILRLLYPTGTVHCKHVGLHAQATGPPRWNPGAIREAFQKAKREFGGRGLLLPDMVDILTKTISSLPRLFICIDALDECTPKHRRDLPESLREAVALSPNIRVSLTGRPHIDQEIVKCFGQLFRIPLSPTHGDIKSYLEMKLDRDDDPDAMDNELRVDIMRIIPEKVSER